MEERNNLVQADSNQIAAAVPLEPMSFADILDGMFSLYRRHFSLFFWIAAVYFVIEFGLGLISLGLFMSAGLSSTTVIIAGFVFPLGSCVVIFWVIAGLTYASAHVYLGRLITPRAALRQASRRFLSFLGVIILFGLVVFGLSITIIGIPFAVYVWGRWGLYSLPIVFEETGVTQALSRSAELVRGTWWRVFGIGLAIFVIVLGIQLILIVSFGALLGVIGPAESEDIATFGELMRNLFIPMPDGSNWLLYAIQQFIIAGIAAFLMPVGVIGGSLLYFDLRIRKEAFDIEMRVVN